VYVKAVLATALTYKEFQSRLFVITGQETTPSKAEPV